MDDFHVNAHASICIGGEIYIDPWNIEGEPHNARVIFITHGHSDHFSPEDIKKVANDKTFFISPADVMEELVAYGFVPNDLTNRGQFVGEKFLAQLENEVYGSPETMCKGFIKYMAFRAYNTDKHFHLRANNWLGFLIDHNGKRYCYLGDTDFISEHKKLTAANIDVLFIPVGGTYTMDAGEAAKCANAIKPKIAVPVHYGSIVGTKEDAGKFAAGLDGGIQCKICL